MDALNLHYRQLLFLDDNWNVKSVKLSTESKRVVIRLEHVGESVICPECSGTCSLKDHAPERHWRHLDTMQFETILEARVPRVNCASCGVKTTTVPWAAKHSRFTILFEAFVIDVLQAASCVSKAATLLGLSWNCVHTIMKRAVQRGLQRRSVDEVTYLGIDEKSFGRGQDYVSIMTDLTASRVLEVAAGRDEKSAKERGNRCHSSNWRRSKPWRLTCGKRSKTAYAIMCLRRTSCMISSTSPSISTKRWTRSDGKSTRSSRAKEMNASRGRSNFGSNARKTFARNRKQNSRP